MIATSTACAITASGYLYLYLYGLVCIGLGFVLGLLLTSPRWRPGGHQPVDRGQGSRPQHPPRKP